MELSNELKAVVDQYWEAAEAEKSVKEQKDVLRQRMLMELPDLLDLPGDKQLRGFKHGLKVRRDDKLKLDESTCQKSEALNSAIDQGKLPEVARYFKLQMSRETFEKVCALLKQNGLISALDGVKLEYEFTEKPATLQKRVLDMQQRVGDGAELNECLVSEAIPRFYLEK